MRPNRKLQALAFLLLLPLVLYTSGCPTAAQWFTLVGDLIPVVSSTYLGLESAASGGALPAAETTAINTLTAGGQDIMNKIGALVQTATTANAAGTSAKIQALIAQMQSDVTGFEADVNIKNSAHAAEYASFAQVLLTDASDIAGLIPIFTSTSTGTATASVTVSKQMGAAKYQKAKSLKGIFLERKAGLPTKLG
jgi:hypothetical protein